MFKAVFQHGAQSEVGVTAEKGGFVALTILSFTARTGSLGGGRESDKSNKVTFYMPRQTNETTAWLGGRP